MLLKRRSPGSRKFVTIAAQRTRSNGTFAFAVVHRKPGTYRYQIIFRPKDTAVWLRSTRQADGEVQPEVTMAATMSGHAPAVSIQPE